MAFALFGRLVQFAVAFATVRVMTTLLEPSEYGKVALITAITAFFALFLINPVGMYVNRHVHGWHVRKVLKRAFRDYLVYVFYVAVLAFTLLYGLATLGAYTFEKSYAVAGLVSLSILFATFNHTLIPSLNMLGRVRAFTWLNMVSVVVSLASAVLFSWWLGASAMLWLFGVLVGQAILAFAALVYYMRSPQIGWGKVQGISELPVKQVLRFSLPVAVSAGFFWLNFQGYRLILSHFVSLEALGLFAAGYGLAVQIMAALELVLNTWFQPRFYQRCDAPDRNVRKSAWVVYAHQVALPCLLAAGLVIAAAPMFVKIMLGPAYQNTVLFVQMGVVVELLRVLSGTAGLYFHQHKTTYKLIVPSAAGAILAILLMIYWVSGWGVVWVLPALAVGALLTFVSLQSWVMHTSGLRFKQFKWIGVCAVLTVFLSVGVYFLVLALVPVFFA